ncbi:hypothetical protein EV182_007281, partial [Spiromyces aspiralis]
MSALTILHQSLRQTARLRYHRLRMVPGVLAAARGFAASAAKSSDKAIETTDKDFDKDVIEAKVPTLVDFYADWCGPCRMLAPILAKAVEKDSRVQLVKINIDENSEAAQEYSIASLPTVIAFHNGKPVDQFVGLRNQKQVE